MLLTQVQLAERLHTTQQAVGSWEAGKTFPRAEFYERMVELFGPYSPLNNVHKKGDLVLLHNMKHAAETGEFDEVIDDAVPGSAPGRAPTLPAPAQSAYAEKLATLFDRLGHDEVIQATVFAHCVDVIAQALNAPTPALAGEAAQERQLGRRRTAR